MEILARCFGFSEKALCTGVHIFQKIEMDTWEMGLFEWTGRNPWRLLRIVG